MCQRRLPIQRPPLFQPEWDLPPTFFEGVSWWYFFSHQQGMASTPPPNAPVTCIDWDSWHFATDPSLGPPLPLSQRLYPMLSHTRFDFEQGLAVLSPSQWGDLCSLANAGQQQCAQFVNSQLSLASALGSPSAVWQQRLHEHHMLPEPAPTPGSASPKPVFPSQPAPSTRAGT